MGLRRIGSDGAVGKTPDRLGRESRPNGRVAATRILIGAALLVVLAIPAQAGVSAPSSTIWSPEHRGLYAHVEGIDAAASGLSVDGLQVWLKKKMKNGTCQNFNGDRFVVRKCARARWLDAEQGLLSSWFYTLPDGLLLRPSDPHSTIKHYVVTTRAYSESGDYETTFEAGRNVNRFDIYGGP